MTVVVDLVVNNDGYSPYHRLLYNGQCLSLWQTSLYVVVLSKDIFLLNVCLLIHS